MESIPLGVTTVVGVTGSRGIGGSGTSAAGDWEPNTKAVPAPSCWTMVVLPVSLTKVCANAEDANMARSAKARVFFIQG